MALKLSSIKRDLAKENDGEWQNIPEWPGVRLKVRSINSRDYQIAREMLLQKLTRQLGRMPTTPEMEPMLAKLVAQHLARGWEGLADEKDVLIEYESKTAMDLISNPEMRALEEQFIWAAMRVGDHNAEFTVDAAKNSAVPSATS